MLNFKLKLEGFVNDNEKKIQEEEYLEKILEIREQIHENDQNNIRRIKIDNENNKAEIVRKLKKHLDNKEYAKALDLLFKFQYLIAIDEAIFSQDEKT